MLKEKTAEKQFQDPYAHLSDEEYNKMKFAEIEQSNEVFKMMQESGKPTEGVSWDNGDFDPRVVYGNDRSSGGPAVVPYNNRNSAHEVDQRWYEWDMHDGRLDGNQYHDR